MTSDPGNIVGASAQTAGPRQTVLDNPLLETLALIAETVGTIIGAPGAASAGPIEVLRQASLQAVRPTLLGAPDVFEAMRRGTITDAEAVNVLTRAGISDRGVEVLRTLIPVLVDVGSLQELRRRELISEEEYATRIRALGFPDDARALLVQLQTFQPTPQDVVSFMTRDAFYPDVVEKYGLDLDFPTDSESWFRHAGVSDEVAHLYWRAHWTLPSVQLAFEMLQRDAETGMTHDDINRLMRAAGIEPYWRDKILAVAYLPYQRVDIRRMYEAGILTDEQVTRAYKDIGYNEERAANLLAFTKVAYSQGKLSALGTFRNGLRTRLIALYERGAISEKDTRAEMEHLGYTAEQQDAFIAESEFVRTSTRYEFIRGQVEKLYTSGDWTKEQATAQLAEQGFSDAELSRLFEEWDVAKTFRDLSTGHRAHRELSKAELLAAYEDQLMPEADVRTALGHLGYDAAEVDVEIHLADVRQKKAARSQMESTVRLLFEAGRMQEADARSRLGALGIGSERVDALISSWIATVRSRTPTLTTGEIGAALTKGIMPEADARRRWAAHGFSSTDVDVLVQLHAPPKP